MAISRPISTIFCPPSQECRGISAQVRAGRQVEAGSQASACFCGERWDRAAVRGTFQRPETAAGRETVNPYMFFSTCAVSITQRAGGCPPPQSPLGSRSNSDPLEGLRTRHPRGKETRGAGAGAAPTSPARAAARNDASVALVRTASWRSVVNGLPPHVSRRSCPPVASWIGECRRRG